MFYISRVKGILHIFPEGNFFEAVSGEVEFPSIEELRIQVCKPRKTGEQKIILYGEQYNAKGSNRRVVKFAPSRKDKDTPKRVIQEVSPTEHLVFFREPFDLERKRR